MLIYIQVLQQVKRGTLMDEVQLNVQKEEKEEVGLEKDLINKFSDFQ